MDRDLELPPHDHQGPAPHDHGDESERDVPFSLDHDHPHHADHDHPHHADHDHPHHADHDHPHADDRDQRGADDHGHDHSHSPDHGPNHGDGDSHAAEHAHHHDHAGGHSHGNGALGLLGEIFHLHPHEAAYDETLEGSAEGIRTLQLSLLGLAITAAIELVIAVRSGSVGLLADTIHNFSDALTAIPLWLAFVVGRWPANRRYTYGYGRAEDVAGVVIVLIILGSAILAFWESIQKLIHPTPLGSLGWVMAAAVVGFLGNEGVSILRIRTGRRIGSAALEADGYHARVDGLTSLGVLVGAVAVWLGLPIADPIVGILISIAILLVSRNAALTMWHRIMDAVDPDLEARARETLQTTPGVQEVHDLRLRWSGHRLFADTHLTLDEGLSLGRAHAIGEDARHRLYHALPRLADIVVHLDPCGHSGVDHHAQTEHHGAAHSAARGQEPL